MASTGITVVLVHGFLSSARTWDNIERLLAADPTLTDVHTRAFRYASPLASLNPTRRIPDLDDLADGLSTFVLVDLADHPHLVLVGHSQGGLVIQRYLARTLRAGRGHELARIRRVVVFACPNAGATIGLTVRRRLLRNPQEADLRPINRAVTEAQQVVLQRVIGASEATDTQWPIPFVAYAGDQDDIVPPASAKSVFPDTGVLPGDHFSIIQPDGPQHRSYVALRSNLQFALTDAAAVATAPVPAPRPEPRLAAPAPPRRISVDAILDGAGGGTGRLVAALLDVPGMTDTDFRRRAYEGLPRPVRNQLAGDARAAVELVGLVDVCERFRHLNPWLGLLQRLNQMLSEDPAVRRLADELLALRLVDQG
jgi:pimeloyl-ACP methyl ester carboxylesterase